MNAFISKKQKIPLTEAHAINNFNFSHGRSLSMSNLSQMQSVNSISSLGSATLGLCLLALCFPPHGYTVAATSLSIMSVFKAEMRNVGKRPL